MTEYILHINSWAIINWIEYQELKVKDWDFVFLRWDSGSGKTTLLKSLSWHWIESSFCKRLFSKDDISFYFHDFMLLDIYSIEENIFLKNAINPGWDLKKKRLLYSDLIERFNLKDRLGRQVSKLSSWEYQRVCLIRSFLDESKVLFFDEPTSFLDEDNKKRVLDYLLECNLKWCTIFLSSHDSSSFSYLKDKVANNRFLIYELDGE